MTENVQVSNTREGGPVAVSVYADGRLDRLSVHVDADSALRTRDYLAESRTVLRLGADTSPDVDVYLSLPALGRLLDVLNDSYTRLTSVQVVALRSGSAA